MLGNLLKMVKIILLVVFLILIINILIPAFHCPSDQNYMEEILRKESEADTPGCEKILCIDDNEDALIWRLRLIGCAQKTVTLATFDLRVDDSGTDILAAVYNAAERGVKVRLLIDGVYQMLFLEKSEVVQALAAHKNVEIRIYNPVTLKNIFRLNYRMHDKYLIVDDRMYMLGGRNTNDIFLGDRKTGINIDRDIMVYDTSFGNGDSLLELQDYFKQVWNERCVSARKAVSDETLYACNIKQLQDRYAELKRAYTDIEKL